MDRGYHLCSHLSYFLPFPILFYPLIWNSSLYGSRDSFWWAILAVPIRKVVLNGWKNQIYSFGSRTSQTELLLGLGQEGLQMLLLFSFLRSDYCLILSKLLHFLFNYIWSQLHSDLWQKSYKTEARVVSLTWNHGCSPLKKCRCLTDIVTKEYRR